MEEEFKREHLAKEADVLLGNDVLMYALAELRAETLEDLANVEATDVTMVVRGQQTIRVIDGLRNRLESYILNKPDTE